MCAKGPARASGSAFGSALVDQAVPGVLPAQHPHEEQLGVVRRDELVDHSVPDLLIGGDRGLAPAPAPGRLGVADPPPRRVEKGQIGDRPGPGILALKLLDLVRGEPRRARAQIGRHRPQVGDDAGRVEQRPRPVDGAGQLLVLQQRPAEQVGGHLLLVDLGDQDAQHLLPYLFARLVVRQARIRRVEGVRPVRGAEPELGPGRLDDELAGRRSLVMPNRRLDRLRRVSGDLQPDHPGIRLCEGRVALRNEIAQRADLHALLAQTREDVGDVGQIGLVRTDEQEPSAPRDPRLGVQEVGGAMQRDDGLARSRAAVDDERAPRSRPDDGVLIGLDRAEHVAHPGRPAAAEARDEGRLVVERGMPLEPVRGEDLVPVVAHPAASPAIPAATRQAHGVGVSRSEEGLGRGRTPVDEQSPAPGVREAEPTDVHGLGTAGSHHASEAQVQPEAAQGPQASRQPMDLEVAVHGRLPLTARHPALGLQAVGEFRDRRLEALPDGGETAFVLGDERRIGLGDETIGKIEGAGAGAGSHDRPFSATTGGLRQAPCRKVQ